ncbi:hypothetical protein D3C87_1454040 [compost metagenome]
MASNRRIRDADSCRSVYLQLEMTEKPSLADYENLKVFLGKFFDWYDSNPHMPPEVHPLHVAASIEKQSMANAKKGLQMALNDIAEDTTQWSPERVAEADARFAAAGTFTLSEIRRRYSKKYLQILKRGVIRSETEYYLVKGIVDGGGIMPGATEATQLQAMMNDFETRFVAAQKQKPPASK